MLHALKLAAKVVNSDASILIQGESGSGKDFLARAIHEDSKRKANPFIAVNCASLPRDLAVAELFGYMPGAFTGASKRGNAGKFEAANGGTLFLDEIGDMPLELQAVLLRALEDKQIVRIGSAKPIPVDVRMIAATHKDLKELVKQGKFREDLFYRLSVFCIYLPPLRERIEDLETFINAMMTASCRKANRDPVRFTSAAIKLLQQYSWPGNLRELRNVIERIAYLHELDVFDSEHVSNFIPIHDDQEKETEDEKYRIQMVLMQTKGNRTEAARILGISRGALYRKLEKYGIK